MMKKSRIMMSFFVIALAAALIGGATMAWFTAKVEVTNEFTAGTVMITAEEDDFLTDDLGNVNPGDRLTKVIDICNTGTKDIVLRVKFAGEWTFSRTYLTNNYYALCYTEDPDYNPSYADVTAIISAAGLIEPASFELGEDWVLDENSGWWYYIGEPIAGEYNEQEAECITLEFDVYFDGDLMDNAFQAATYKLDARFEAVQASNDAPFEVWGVDYYQ